MLRAGRSCRPRTLRRARAAIEPPAEGQQEPERAERAEDVAHAPLPAVERADGAGQDEPTHAELEEHLDLETDHERNLRVARRLVQVHAALERDDALAREHAGDHLPRVSLELAQILE